jgi:hypothetical protein
MFSQACPEILAFEEEVVNDIHEMVKAQVRRISKLSRSCIKLALCIDQQGHVDEFREGNEDTETAFAISLYQVSLIHLRHLGFTTLVCRWRSTEYST